VSVFKELIDKSSILSFIGTGGVGKTTFSMTAAVAAAKAGKRVAAITVDPSKRLSTALGIQTSSTESQTLAWPEFSGALDVYVLDTETTFRDFVSKHIPENFRDGMLQNKIFKQISKNLRETHNFAAIYKLHQIDALGTYDLIVLDTPPSQAAVDFFEAPEQLKRFFSFEGFQKVESMKWVSWVGDKSLTVFKMMIRKFAGGDFLEEMLQFFSNVRGLKDEIDIVTSELIAKMSSEDCRFVLVTSSAQDKMGAAIDLAGTLENRGFKTRHCIVNQAYQSWLDGANEVEFSGDASAEKLYTYFKEQKENAREMAKAGTLGKNGEPMQVSLMPTYPFAVFSKEQVIELSRKLQERW